ncbi:hypothetical protein [Microcoleus sp. herbarium5]|uniref:hypothetical protein n=1 Tax=Microcoleus sp. herbarium5 TaxID=3055434 RepID=UPI002FD6DB69
MGVQNSYFGGKETSVDGGKVRLRKEEGEGSHWLDYKAVRLHDSYYGAFFLENQALINYVDSQPLSEVLTCLRDRPVMAFGISLSS